MLATAIDWCALVDGIGSKFEDFGSEKGEWWIDAMSGDEWVRFHFTVFLEYVDSLDEESDEPVPQLGDARVSKVETEGTLTTDTEITSEAEQVVWRLLQGSNATVAHIVKQSN